MASLDDDLKRLVKANAERVRAMKIKPNDTYPDTQLDLVVDVGPNTSMTLTLNEHELRHLARVIADWHIANAKKRRK